MSGLAYRHQRVQRLRRLVAKRSGREEEGRFVLEGVNLLEEALGSGTPIEGVYVDSAWAGRTPPNEGPERLNALLARCYDVGARVFELEEGVLGRVAGTVTPQPVLTVAEMPRPDLAAVLGGLAPGKPALVVVGVDVRDPGNAGTVARTAWAAGADALVCCQGTVDMWNPKTVRASAGAVLHIPVVSTGPAAPALDELGAHGLARWGTVVKGGQDYVGADLSGPVALVLGNEASGLPLGELGSHLDGLVSIPMAGGARSLNVSTAAAVLCFEVVRQRRLGRMGGADARRTP